MHKFNSSSVGSFEGGNEKGFDAKKREKAEINKFYIPAPDIKMTQNVETKKKVKKCWKNKRIGLKIKNDFTVHVNPSAAFGDVSGECEVWQPYRKELKM